MKVGVLTVFDAVNYGSYLQAYCLQSVLKSKGITDVRMIKDSSMLYEKWRLTSLITYKPQKMKFKSRLSAGYRKAWKQFRKASPRDRFDLVIVGSDEMWEVNNITMEPRPTFFGIGLNTKHLVSYAVSSNTAKPKDLQKYPFIAEGVGKFDKVSVRDASTYETYAPLLKEPPVYCIDPTLLVDLRELSKQRLVQGDYILCYTYSFKPETVAAVKALAAKYNKKIVVAGQSFDWADEVIPASPFEFLSLILNADFVVTDTFHGTVLSIALNKQFVTSAYKEKVYRVVEQFDLLDRNIHGGSDIIIRQKSTILPSTIRFQS